jgi:hypothetical protein
LEFEQPLGLRVRPELRVRRDALIAPILGFFTPYYPETGDPLPESISRHAAVHQPAPEHYTRTNALIGLMLCVSILREQEDWCLEVRLDERDEDP